VPAAEATGRPRWPRLLGFDPSGRPWQPCVGLARRPLDAPLGFCRTGSFPSIRARPAPWLFIHLVPPWALLPAVGTLRTPDQALPELPGMPGVPSIHDLHVAGDARSWLPVRPSEYSIRLLVPGVAALGHPLGIGFSFRVFLPLNYRPLGQAVPLCRQAVSLGCVVFLQRAGLVAVKLPTASSLRVSPSSRVLPSRT
jgi:hypothetical protein